MRRSVAIALISVFGLIVSAKTADAWHHHCRRACACGGYSAFYGGGGPVPLGCATSYGGGIIPFGGGIVPLGGPSQFVCICGSDGPGPLARAYGGDGPRPLCYQCGGPSPFVVCCPCAVEFCGGGGGGVPFCH